MSKNAFAIITIFCILLFSGILYLFLQPADINGWITLFVMLMINPGLLLGAIACEVRW